MQGFHKHTLTSSFKVKSLSWQFPIWFCDITDDSVILKGGMKFLKAKLLLFRLASVEGGKGVQLNWSHYKGSLKDWK